MDKLLGLLGLHFDQQTRANLWTKLLGLASLVAGGFLSPAQVLRDGFGLVISEAANGRIKWWCVAIGAVVTYITSQNTEVRTAPKPNGVGTPAVWVPLLIGASLLTAGCATGQKLTTPVLTPTEADRVVLILTEAEWGVREAGTVQWLSPAQTQLGVDILETTIKAAKEATTSPIAAAQAALTAWAGRDGVAGSRLEIYLRVAVAALDLVKQAIAAGSSAAFSGGSHYACVS